ncbi:GLPGLI family protein [uncultured Alistipes sp.]|uniref:GLPGLI family protein n=1 Tax=uncultured Alistipes sp. TaxID=538949 RepID=UPI0025F9F45F|nr:GLPGLI family protein [uncultured Alistipes sp.]
MKMILFFLLVCATSAWAQSGKRHVSMTNCSEVGYGLCDLSQKETIDTTHLTAIYKLTTVHEGSQRWAQMILQVGARYTRYFGLLKQLNDEYYTMFLRRQTPSEEFIDRQRAAGNGGERFAMVVINDRTTATRKVIHFIPITNDRTLSYEEPIEPMSWEITQRQDTVAGYLCTQAEANFRGRRYRAWFAPDIPLNIGPWKFAGLPGLVLRAEDADGAFVWECVGIETAREPIFDYRIPDKRTTREQYIKWERAYHRAPATMLNLDGRTVFKYWDRSTKTSRELGSEWTLPYNPIELE